MSDFLRLFGRPAIIAADAPGRVNLIGEHTDYNDGFVLPVAIPQRTRVQLAPREDSEVRVHSTALATEPPRTYQLGQEKPAHEWIDYVQGVTHILAKEGLPIRGFDAALDSNVPLGSGVSSSAALTVSLMRALRSAFHLELTDVRIAQLGRRVENEFVGAQVGIMDPMAASLADERHALFLDARTLYFERVPLPVEADLVVIHSGVSHRLAAGEGYNTRVQECKQACELLGVSKLRDVSAADLPRIAKLPEPLDRRARHVVTENVRVQQAVLAMIRGDLIKLGELFFASHASMRDDYAVSAPEVDLLVELARNDREVYGARLTGGGFGGSVVLLTRRGTGQLVAQRLATQYAERSGCQPRILVPPGLSP